jgi:ribosomal-protein-alanine N-acetyltransferase
MADIVRGNTWEASIGWRVAASAQGQGLAHEMVAAAIAWCFAPSGPGLHRLSAAIMPGIDRSIRLAERLGFALEGTKRCLIRIGGVWHDHHIFGLINDAWAPPAP